MELKEQMDQVRAFCEERDWDQFHSAKDLAIGLVTEASELLELFRFQSETQAETLLKEAASRNKIGDEMADIFFFLLRFSQRFDFDLVDCLSQKMEKNAKKYPVEKSKGKNLKYNQLL